MNNYYLFNRVCVAAEKMEKKKGNGVLAHDEFFMVYPKCTGVDVYLCFESDDAFEELYGGNFHSVRAFKTYFKNAVKCY